MKSRMKKNLLQAIYFIQLALFCLPVLASSTSKAQEMEFTRASSASWVASTDRDAGSKEFSKFHNLEGGLVKLSPNYLHGGHSYKHSAAVVIIEGDLTIATNGKTTTFNQADFYTLPGNTCITTSSKKGAILAVLFKGRFEKSQKCSPVN